MKRFDPINNAIIQQRTKFLSKRFGSEIHKNIIELWKEDINVLSPLGASELFLKCTGIEYSLQEVANLAEKICCLKNMRQLDIPNLQKKFGISTLELWSLWILAYNQEDSE